MKKIIVLSLGIILIAAACNKSTNTPTPSPTPNPPTGEVISGETEIELTSSGFSPSEIIVKKGTKVTFKNTDSKPHWPASDPHPIHTDLSGFDALKGLVQGETYTYTFDKVGRWKMHDHLNSGLRGQITVVE